MIRMIMKKDTNRLYDTRVSNSASRARSGLDMPLSTVSVWSSSCVWRKVPNAPEQVKRPDVSVHLFISIGIII